MRSELIGVLVCVAGALGGSCSSPGPQRTEAGVRPHVMPAEALQGSERDEVFGVGALMPEPRLGEMSDYIGPARLSPEEFAAATAGDSPELWMGTPAEDGVSYSIVQRRAPKKFQITLRNDFIEKYKNRVTLTTDFEIIGASGVHSIGKGGDDGDIHCGGMADEVGLPCVAEVMNAKLEPNVAKDMQDRAKTRDSVRMTGAWRLWCEHPGVPQIQDDTEYAGKHKSNPDHVFELHPVTRYDGKDIRGTVKAIPGYTAYDAEKGFQYYESVTCTMKTDPQTQTTTLLTPQAKYNYVEFHMRAEEDAAFTVHGGLIVRASVLDKQKKVIVRNRRMVFINGTDSAAAAKDLKEGDELHLLGIPRIDLAVVSWRARSAAARPEVLTWNLPYEIIVVGVYDN